MKYESKNIKISFHVHVFNLSFENRTRNHTKKIAKFNSLAYMIVSYPPTEIVKNILMSELTRLNSHKANKFEEPAKRLSMIRW